MKKNISAIYMLMSLILLSCNTSPLDELISKARGKFIAKKENKEDLDFIEKTQKSRKVVEQYMEGREKQIVPAVPVEAVSVEDLVILNYPYYPQKEREIKEEDLVPITDEEKKAEKAIIDGSCNFAKLVDDEHKLKNEYEQLESSFYNAIVKVKNKVEMSYLRQNKMERQKHNNAAARQKLIQLRNQLNDKRADIYELRIKLESGLNERISAKYFFEQAQKTLKEAITERLKNKHKRYWSRKIDSNFLAKQAQNEAENALNQLETSSIKIVEVMGRKKEIEKLIQETNSVLVSFKR
ncbi:P12 family lipoprotein [Borreliella bavariensis]|uniref:P12 family lipoprotein n=1 Tax=Borreliella bavariensis TaxID=664662 RepID=UPI001C006717|nr:P12 family lipoprotein [Borreliella bavariensis]